MDKFGEDCRTVGEGWRRLERFREDWRRLENVGIGCRKLEKFGESWRRLEKVRRLKMVGEVCSMVGEVW